MPSMSLQRAQVSCIRLRGMLDRHAEFVATLQGTRVKRARVDAVARVLRRVGNVHSHRYVTAVNLGLILRHLTHREQHLNRMRSFASMLSLRTQEVSRALIERERAVAHRVRLQRESVHHEVTNRSERTVAIMKEHPARVPMVMPRPQGMSAQPVTRKERTPAIQQVEQSMRPLDREVSAMRAAAPMLPPQELSRVTDHVIRQLDQRVLSYRERTGRL